MPKSTPVYFPDDVKQLLRRAAFEREASMSAVVVEAVREKLGGGGESTPEAARREIRAKYEAAEAYCRDRQYEEGTWAAFIARDVWKQAWLAVGGGED